MAEGVCEDVSKADSSTMTSVLNGKVNSAVDSNETNPIEHNEVPQQEAPMGFWTSSRKDRICLFLTKILALTLACVTLWGILGEAVLPGSEIFSILLLGFCCHIAGYLVELVKLPGLIGMLIMGFLFRNSPFITYYYISHHWASSLRNIALAIILLRAGFNLDPKKLRIMSFVCLRLAFTPCVIEAVTIGYFSHFLLYMPWSLGLALGFVLAAVSPAVLVPSMLALAEMGYGQDKGISTVCIAACSIDDVFAIIGFGICTGVAFAQGNLAWTILKPPLEVFAGVAYGCVFGIVFWYLPHEKETFKTRYQFVLLISGGLCVMFASQAVNLVSAGAMGCLCLAFVAALKWRLSTGEVVSEALATVWFVAQNFFFGLIGAEVSLSDLGDGLELLFVILVIGLVLRILTCFAVLTKSGFNVKEKVFVALAWTPKATVQAAIGPVVLDLAISLGFPDYMSYGHQILTTAVLSILVTAPLGAIAINCLGPRLLQKPERSSTPFDLEEINSADEKHASSSLPQASRIETT